MIELIHGDCLEKMKDIPDGSIDMVLTDPPYGTTACKWDSIIPLEPMWEQLKRVIKSNGAIALTASQPFTTKLIASNYEMFKYEWIWEKGRASGFLHSKNKPLKAHENIIVFSGGTTVHVGQSKNRMLYLPQMMPGKSYERKRKSINTGNLNHTPSLSNIDFIGNKSINEGTRYPRSIVKFKNHNVGNYSPTQKPVALMEFLIKTYTNEGEAVLDFTMGSGTTGIACKKLNRNFIGIELDENYFNIAQERITNVVMT